MDAGFGRWSSRAAIVVVGFIRPIFWIFDFYFVLLNVLLQRVSYFVAKLTLYFLFRKFYAIFISKKC